MAESVYIHVYVVMYLRFSFFFVLRFESWSFQLGFWGGGSAPEVSVEFLMNFFKSKDGDAVRNCASSDKQQENGGKNVTD